VDTRATEAGRTAGGGSTEGEVGGAATSLTAGETIVRGTRPAATN